MMLKGIVKALEGRTVTDGFVCGASDVCSVSVVEEATVTTRPGPSGIKTKGAVAACFHIFGSSFLFINSHFTGLFFAVCNVSDDDNRTCKLFNIHLYATLCFNYFL